MCVALPVIIMARVNGLIPKVPSVCSPVAGGSRLGNSFMLLVPRTNEGSACLATHTTEGSVMAVPITRMSTAPDG